MPYPAEEYVQTYTMHRDALLDLLERVPAEQADFAPWEGGRTFTQLTDHFAAISDTLTATASGRPPEGPEPSPDLASALTRLRTADQAARQALTGLDKAWLSGEISAFGVTMPLYRFIDFVVQHEAHHKGQVWQMARMIGLEPPFFVKLS